MLILSFFLSFFLSWHTVALFLFVPLQGAAVNVSRPLRDFSIFQFCFVFSHSAFTPSVTPFEVVAWVLVDKGASISWIWGWCSGGRGWIKNQSNWSGLWRRRTPCETVNHVPQLNMSQGFTVVTEFCFLASLCAAGRRPCELRPQMVANDQNLKQHDKNDVFIGFHSVSILHPVAALEPATRYRSSRFHQSPSTPATEGETMRASATRQVPAGPQWSKGGEFGEQPLVVPTQQTSFTVALIKADNIPSAWALFFSRQLKASPRRRYKCLLGA